MWYFQKNPIVLVLIITDNTLFCILVQKPFKQQLTILDYTFFTDTAYTLKDGIVYNYSAIKKTLSSFVQKNNRQPSFMTIIIDNKQLLSNFSVATQPSSSATKESFSKQTMHTHYLGPYHDTDHLLYTCKIVPHALLQYQLLAANIAIPLLSITCSMQPLLFAYRGYKQTAFRSSELVKDIVRHDEHFTDFFTQDMINRLIPAICIDNAMYKKSFLMTYGYFLYQEFMHG